MNQKSLAFLVRCVAAAITIGLLLGMYKSHLQSTEAEVGLQKAQKSLKTAKQEHEKWTTIRNELSEQMSKTGYAFQSFNREEMRPARQDVMDGIECDKAFFFSRRGSFWAIWLPEDGHQLEVHIDVPNLRQSDVLEGELALKTNLKFELKPGQLHTFSATCETTEKRKGEVTALLRCQFDQEKPIEITFKGEQLALDRLVADREGLKLKTIQGDMRDLGVIKEESFDLIVHVCSNAFVPDILPVWKECHRVLRSGGELLSGFLNPDSFIFDHEAIDRGEPLLAVNRLPYSDVNSVSPEHYQHKINTHDLLEFSHSMSDQIGGQIAAGFHIVGFFEDSWQEFEKLNEFFPLLFSTRARKF